MKLTKKKLEELILEALKFGEMSNLAVFKNSDSLDTYVFFNINMVNEIIQAYQSYGDDPEMLAYELQYSPNLIGMAEIRNHSDKCNDSREIIKIATQDGWGPTIYDIIMGESPSGIISDRSSVSDEAYSVYNFYYKNRAKETSKSGDGTVSAKPLDAPSGKWTPNNKADDCRTGGHKSSPSEEELNSMTWDQYKKDPLAWSYNRKMVPKTKTLYTNYKKVEKKLKNAGAEKAANSWFWTTLADLFFDQRYN